MLIALSPLFQGLQGHSTGLHLHPRVQGHSLATASATPADDASTNSTANRANEADAAGSNHDSRAVKLLQSSLRYHLGSFSQQSASSAPSTSSAPASSGAPVPGDAQTTDKAAQNILGFITNRLQQAAANGADQSQLDKLLQQARDGVQKGYQEARDQLKSLGLLSPQLDQSISQSLTSVTKGLDKLQQQIDNPSASNPQGDASGAGTTNSTGSTGDSTGAASGVSSSQAAAIESSSHESLKLNITTKDGDKVTILLDERQYDGASLSTSQNSSGQTVLSQSAHLFSGHYQIKVQGQLDAGEQKSITDLLDKVQSLSNTFFNGNVQDAFKQSQSLGIDGSSLAKFSLSLSYSKSVRAAAYSQASSSGSSTGASLQPVSQLASGVQGASQQATQSGVNTSDFASLFQQLLGNNYQQATALGQPVASKDFLSQFLQALLTPASGDSTTPASSAGASAATDSSNTPAASAA